MKSVYFYDYPVGSLGIAEQGGEICRVFFCEDKALAGFKTAQTPLIKLAAAQLDEYFAAKRTSFDLPLCISGTDFQLSVWEALRQIPAGEVRSYKAVAEMVQSPRAYRAVGMANRNNPLVIIIPCHRVTGAGGGLTGYIGGLAAKKYLLELEKRGE